MSRWRRSKTFITSLPGNIAMPLHYSCVQEPLSIKCAEISLFSSALDDKNSLLYTLQVTEILFDHRPPGSGRESCPCMHPMDGTCPNLLPQGIDKMSKYYLL